MLICSLFYSSLGRRRRTAEPGGYFTKRIYRTSFPEKQGRYRFLILLFTHSCKIQSLQKDLKNVETVLLCSTFRRSYLRAVECCRAATCFCFEIDFSAKLLYFYCKIILVSAEGDEQITFLWTVLGRC